MRKLRTVNRYRTLFPIPTDGWRYVASFLGRGAADDVYEAIEPYTDKMLPKDASLESFMDAWNVVLNGVPVGAVRVEDE